MHYVVFYIVCNFVSVIHPSDDMVVIASLPSEINIVAPGISGHRLLVSTDNNT